MLSQQNCSRLPCFAREVALEVDQCLPPPRGEHRGEPGINQALPGGFFKATAWGSVAHLLFLMFLGPMSIGVDLYSLEEAC